MNLTLHELSIGASLMRPISKQDNTRQAEWLEMHLPELFTLAKEALQAREQQRKATLKCDECSLVGDHATKDCPFPHKHVPLFPEIQ